MKPLIRNPDGTITAAEEGDGWVVVTVAEFAEMNPGDTIVSMTNNPDLPITVRRYVPPVPPLPTEPYTVIRVTAPTMQKRLVCVLHEDGKWWDIRGVAQRDLSTITGFEVLSEPRAVGYGRGWQEATDAALPAAAKAVLDRVKQTDIWQVILLANPKNGAKLDTIGRDFGVEA